MRARLILAVLAGSGCKFSELPPLADDAGTADAPLASCATDGPDPACPSSSPICVAGQCTADCEVDGDCARRPANEAVCDVVSGACVQCDEVDRQAEPGSAEDECRSESMAVCDGATRACRACRAHGECASGVCDTGRCARESEAVYLDVTGADAGPCGTRTQPCLTLDAAIGRVQAAPAAFKYIVMQPSATPYRARNNTDRAVFDTVTVQVIGDGASVQRGGDGVVIEVRGAANVTIDGLTVKNATGIAGHGISCSLSTLTLRGAAVLRNDGDGILSSGCALSVSGSNIADNGLIGIEASGGAAEISRTTVASNRGGGLLISGSFRVVNNFIVGNGNLVTANLGGIDVSSSTIGNTLEFNTVAFNQVGAGLSDAIHCINAGLTARNNIMVGSADRPHATGNCVHAYSLFTPNNLVAGEMNSLVPTVAAYNFASATDLHLQAGSAASGRAQATGLAGESLFDIDGEPRTGNAIDVGADEIP